MQFADTYSRLPARFFTLIAPTQVAAPRLIKFNERLAAELGLSVRNLGDDALARLFSGNELFPESRPLAMAYAGHQFGHFVPQLGDGRAILLGEVQAPSGSHFDVQLKGAGRTPYSRGGDGRAALGPVLREYLVSEAMHAFGLPTTRSLAAVLTGERVNRERPLPGAILTRVAASHIRVGTFQYFAARQDWEGVKLLADHVIERHYPQAAAAADPYLELLRCVVRRQAGLVAGWMNVGFIHGVMNTDNMAVSGETIDFGPCAFMDAYDPATVFSSIDHMGRYAYSNQPAAAQWNLARFAEVLIRIMDGDGDAAVGKATAAIEEFSARFDEVWLEGMRRKLGLFTEEDGDAGLARRLLEFMHVAGADFSVTFRRLCAAVESEEADAGVDRAWIQEWRARLTREPQPQSEHASLMRLSNPCYIPRNHRIEAAILAAVERLDFAPFEELHEVLSRPYEERSGFSAYAAPPLPEERVLQTFCGT